MTASRDPDWKVTRGHRLLVLVGSGVAALAVYFGVAAVALGMPGLWWRSALLALAALGVGAALPEPVPHDMFTESRTTVAKAAARVPVDGQGPRIVLDSEGTPEADPSDPGVSGGVWEPALATRTW